MRFQANSSFSKLAPTFVADPYGQFSSSVTSMNPGANLGIVGSPANSMLRIRAITLTSATATASSAYIRAYLESSGATLAVAYQSANGSEAMWTGDIAVVDTLACQNNMAAGAPLSYCNVVYRIEPIPGT